MRLGPFDEVSHDQEVAGIVHLDDNAEFEIKPLLIGLNRKPFSPPHRGQPVGQASIGLAAQLLGFIAIAKARQDGLQALDDIGAAQRNLDGVLNGLRNVCKQCRHFLLRFEIMFRRHAPAVIGGNHLPLGNADQRVMGGIIIRLGEVYLIGGNQWHFQFIGQFNQTRFSATLGFRAMALQLNVEAVAEGGFQPLGQAPCKRALPLQQGFIQGAIGTTRQANQASAQFLQQRP